MLGVETGVKKADGKVTSEVKKVETKTTKEVSSAQTTGERYKAKVVNGVHVKKDGTPDKRYKENQTK